MSTGAGAVEVTRDGHVLTIAITRPERRNAMTYAAWDELGAAFTAAAAGDARVVVVTGSGGAFCSGGDLEGGDRAAHPHAQLAAVARRLAEEGAIVLKGCRHFAAAA